MNQLTRTVTVKRATQREFTANNWKQVQEKLKLWTENLSEMLGVLANAKLSAPSVVPAHRVL
jgi:hypothetical protein